MVPSHRKPSAECAYQGCTNNRTLHRFPKCDVRSSRWVQASGNPKLEGISVSKLNAAYHLCSDHFHDWCFVNLKNKRRLVHNAVPDAQKVSFASFQKEQMKSAKIVTSRSSVPETNSRYMLFTPENSDDSLAESPSLASEHVPEIGIVQKGISLHEEQHLSEPEISDADSLSDSASYHSTSSQMRKRKLSVEEQLLRGQQKLQNTCENIAMCMKRICVSLEETTAALKTLTK